PVDGRLLRALDDRRRIASLARHLELAAVPRPGSSGLDAARPDRGQSAGGADCRRLRGHCRVGLHGAADRRSAPMTLDPRVPAGPIAEKWDRHKFEMKLVNPANKRKYTIIVVGTGLAGASAAASLGELGYNVLNFCIQD